MIKRYIFRVTLFLTFWNRRIFFIIWTGLCWVTIKKYIKGSFKDLEKCVHVHSVLRIRISATHCCLCHTNGLCQHGQPGDTGSIMCLYCSTRARTHNKQLFLSTVFSLPYTSWSNRCKSYIIVIHLIINHFAFTFFDLKKKNHKIFLTVYWQYWYILYNTYIINV